MSAITLRRVLAVAALAVSGSLHAQEAPAAALTETPTITASDHPSATGVLLKVNTVIELELVDPVSSKTSKPGDYFKLRVAAPVSSGDVVLIPVGTPAMGQVVHAQKAGIGGKGGELIVAARYLDTPHGQIKLHSGFGAVGKDRTGAALATAIAFGIVGMAVKGKEMALPAGQHVLARVAIDTQLDISP